MKGPSKAVGAGFEMAPRNPGFGLLWCFSTPPLTGSVTVCVHSPNIHSPNIHSPNIHSCTMCGFTLKPVRPRPIASPR